MEEWKDIEGYEGLYQVSSIGRVRSLGRMIKNHHGTYYFKAGKIKSQRRKNNGYLIVDLYKDNIPKTCHIHRLVANAFILNPRGKKTVNHKDGIVTNNKVDNLEWATPHEQNIHFYRIGLKKEENIYKAVKAMNEVQKRKVCCKETGKIYNSLASAAKTMGRKDASLICACCKRKRKNAYGYTWEYV